MSIHIAALLFYFQMRLQLLSREQFGFHWDLLEFKIQYPWVYGNPESKIGFSFYGKSFTFVKIRKYYRFNTWNIIVFDKEIRSYYSNAEVIELEKAETKNA